MALAQMNDTSGAEILVGLLDRGYVDKLEGMTPEQSQQAFTSLLNTTKPKGAGLGLAIVGRVVESHRGQTAIQSAKGQGTTITLSFPIG